MAFYSAANFFPESSVGYRLRRCQQLSVAALDRALADEGLTAVQWSALVSIRFGDSPTCAMLARDLAHDKGAMTRMIDTLEARGLVARQRDAADRRVVNLSLTPEGEAIAMRGRARAIDLWNAVLDGWSEADATALLNQLKRLETALETTPCAD